MCHGFYNGFYGGYGAYGGGYGAFGGGYGGFNGAYNSFNGAYGSLNGAYGGLGIPGIMGMAGGIMQLVVLGLVIVTAICAIRWLVKAANK